ncbi:MAG: hypothetical protein ABJA66_17125 [Actinomycetota bacterium]
MKKLLFFIFLMLFSFNAFAQKTPLFKQYASKVEKVKVQKVNFASHKRAKTFRTNLSNALKEGVNFAGHFILATWGCGTNCSDSGIIDARTGNVYFPKELEGIGIGFCEIDYENTEPLAFKPDSRLLVLSGFKGGDLNSEKTSCGIYYFEWTGTSLKKVGFVKKKRTSTP